MTEANITVYGTYWCPDCRRSKKFLGEQFVPFTWVDIEQDQEGEAFVIQKNGGKRIIPTIVFEDGSLLVEPFNAELARKLGLKTETKKTYYDLIIIGGGPAGLTAAIYASREAADVLSIERSGLGGQEMARKSPGTGITAMQMYTALRSGVMVSVQKQQVESTKTLAALIRADHGGLIYQPIIGLHIISFGLYCNASANCAD